VGEVDYAVNTAAGYVEEACIYSIAPTGVNSVGKACASVFFVTKLYNLTTHKAGDSVK
jgi:hypothetical protein